MWGALCSLTDPGPLHAGTKFWKKLEHTWAKRKYGRKSRDIPVPPGSGHLRPRAIPGTPGYPGPGMPRAYPGMPGPRDAPGPGEHIGRASTTKQGRETVRYISARPLEVSRVIKMRVATVAKMQHKDGYFVFAVDCFYEPGFRFW